MGARGGVLDTSVVEQTSPRALAALARLEAGAPSGKRRRHRGGRGRERGERVDALCDTSTAHRRVMRDDAPNLPCPRVRQCARARARCVAVPRACTHTRARALRRTHAEAARTGAPRRHPRHRAGEFRTCWVPCGWSTSTTLPLASTNTTSSSIARRDGPRHACAWARCRCPCAGGGRAIPWRSQLQACVSRAGALHLPCAPLCASKCALKMALHQNTCSR